MASLGPITRVPWNVCSHFPRDPRASNQLGVASRSPVPGSLRAGRGGGQSPSHHAGPPHCTGRGGQLGKASQHPTFSPRQSAAPTPDPVSIKSAQMVWEFCWPDPSSAGRVMSWLCSAGSWKSQFERLLHSGPGTRLWVTDGALTAIPPRPDCRSQNET